MDKLRTLYILLLAIITTSYYGCFLSSSSLRYNPKPQNTPSNITSHEKETFITKDSLDIDIFEEDDLEDYTGETLVNSSQVIENIRSNISSLSADQATLTEKMLVEVIRFLNTPYKYGGNSDRGIDCSAFSQRVFNAAFNIKLLRSAREQYTQGETINSTNSLKFGDLVFFNTRRAVRPGHVGIYLGDGYFVHASSKRGVIVSSMSEGYYNQRYMGARRHLD